MQIVGFLMRRVILLNPFLTSRFSHHYHFGKSTFILWGVGSNFLILISFFDEISLIKQNSPRWDAASCGVTSGAILFAYVPQMDTRLIVIHVYELKDIIALHYNSRGFDKVTLHLFAKVHVMHYITITADLTPLILQLG